MEKKGVYENLWQIQNSHDSKEIKKGPPSSHPVEVSNDIEIKTEIPMGAELKYISDLEIKSLRKSFESNQKLKKLKYKFMEADNFFYAIVASLPTDILPPNLTIEAQVKHCRELCAEGFLSMDQGDPDDNWLKRWNIWGKIDIDYENYPSKIKLDVVDGYRPHIQTIANLNMLKIENEHTKKLLEENSLDETKTGPDLELKISQNKIKLAEINEDLDKIHKALDEKFIWGEAEIEGRILCKKLGIAIHMVSLASDQKPLHRMIRADLDLPAQYIEASEVDYGNQYIVHIANHGKYFTAIPFAFERSIDNGLQRDRRATSSFSFFMQRKDSHEPLMSEFDDDKQQKNLSISERFKQSLLTKNQRIASSASYSSKFENKKENRTSKTPRPKGMNTNSSIQ